MIREKIKSLLGIDRLESKIEEQNKEVLSELESIKTQLAVLEQKIKALEDESVRRQEILPLKSSIDNMEAEILSLKKLFEIKIATNNFATDEDLIRAIRELISVREEMPISEAVEVLGVSKYRFYKALSLLEKAGDVKRVKKGKQVYLVLTNPKLRYEFAETSNKD